MAYQYLVTGFHLASPTSIKTSIALLPPLPTLFSHLHLLPELLGHCRGSLPHLHQFHALLLISGAASGDRFTSNHLLLAYSHRLDLPSTRKLFDTMPQKNTMSFNILLRAHVKSGDLTAARLLFEETPFRNAATYNALVAAYADAQNNEEGLLLFLRMIKDGYHSDEFTLGSTLRCCAGARDLWSGKKVHAYVVKLGFEFDMCVGSSLAHMYMKCGFLLEGELLLRALPNMNVVTCNTMIAGRVQNGDSEGAVEYFALLKAAGLVPDDVTFVSVVNACSDLAAHAQGRQLHAQAVRTGADAVLHVRSSLVNMYSRCGCLDDAVLVFTEAHMLDLVLWSTMIAAYGFHGHGHEAVNLFDKMVKEGLKPSEVTFLSLLHACSHSGLKDEGKRYFDLMTKTYGFKPCVKHYTCIVDLLGRAGCLEEAEALIKSMPVHADAIIWKTLLSACKTHKKAEIAERVAEHVLQLDPEDSASYVLLSNIHASDRRWAEVSKVRDAMWDKRVKKEPGISWLELKGQVHEFATGDRSHPMEREIHMCLKEMARKIREMGYTPDTGKVLHDMEDEEKEDSLAHHSEKLAVAFGLLCLPASAPVRVMKNLRVCEDCHLAIKLIAKVAGREIVVRDVSRFHHFRDGKCSCGDYW